MKKKRWISFFFVFRERKKEKKVFNFHSLFLLMSELKMLLLLLFEWIKEVNDYLFFVAVAVVVVAAVVVVVVVDVVAEKKCW